MKCDQCGKKKGKEFLVQINPEGGLGRPRFLMCNDCLRAAPKGSYAAMMYEIILNDYRPRNRIEDEQR